MNNGECHADYTEAGNAYVIAELTQAVPCDVQVQATVTGHITCGIWNSHDTYRFPIPDSGGDCKDLYNMCGDIEGESFTIPANSTRYEGRANHFYAWGPREFIRFDKISNSCGYTITGSGGVL
jgi:hypothetical protein